MKNAFLTFERTYSKHGKTIIVENAFDEIVVVFRNKKRTVIQLADAKIGENIYNTKNQYLGYVNSAFDRDAEFKKWLNA